MQQIRNEIARRAEALAQHPFLVGLERSQDPDDLRRIIPPLYFWVFSFQDVLRLTTSRVEHPEYRAIATTHQNEDAGHEAWFVNDARTLGAERDVEWLFGPEHQQTRDTSYEMVSEILHTNDDRIRLLVPLILEAIGSVFFPRVVGLVERCGLSDGLQYFARSHQDVEASHDLFTEGTKSQLDGIEFDPATYVEALATVDRCFARAHDFASHLEVHRVRGRAQA